MARVLMTVMLAVILECILGCALLIQPKKPTEKSIVADYYKALNQNNFAGALCNLIDLKKMRVSETQAETDRTVGFDVEKEIGETLHKIKARTNTIVVIPLRSMFGLVQPNQNGSAYFIVGMIFNLTSRVINGVELRCAVFDPFKNPVGADTLQLNFQIMDLAQSFPGPLQPYSYYTFYTKSYNDLTPSNVGEILFTVLAER